MVIATPPGFNMCLRSPESQVDVGEIMLKYRLVCTFLFYGRLGGGGGGGGVGVAVLLKD